MNPLDRRSDEVPAGRALRWDFVVLMAGAVTMALGLLALLGWGFGWPLLAGFGADRIPMAPSTAVLFLLYGAAICLRARSPLGRRAQWGSGALAGFGILVALLLFTLGWRDIQWTGEHLGLNIAQTVGSTPIGHMSLVTACCFLLTGVSFLASLSPSATRPWRAGLALVSSVLLLGTCFVFLLAYGFGTPLLYGGSFIPPTLNTILAFITLGMALMALAHRPGGVFRGSLGDDSRPAFAFVLIFALLALGIVVTGYAYYRSFERQSRAQAGQQLSAIAELKVGELVRYRMERLGDAAVLHDNPALIESARRFLASPADTDAQRQLEAWLAKYQGHFQYDLVRLLDAQGVTRLSVPAGLPPVSSAVARGASEVLRSGQPAIQDFYRSEHDQRIYLAVLVPLFDEADGHRPLGVVVARIDPATYLFPFISRWPVPSATAETLLVRREGNEAVYLNELRFQKDTALTLRIPLANTSIPAVKAALGQQGIVQGEDYRGVPVLAAVGAVPDSPWAMVARRDLAEVHAPLRQQGWQVIALVAVLLFGAGAGVGLVWRQQRIRHYRQEAETVEALQESRSLLARAERLGRVGGWEIDLATGKLIWTEMVYDIHELDGTGRPTVDQGINYYTPESRPIIERAVQRAMEQGEPFDLELEIITAKGNRRSVRTVGQPDRARARVSGFFQDVTERKRVEAERQKFFLLAESSSEFIGMCDLDLQPLYVNPAGQRMVGLPDMAAACRVKVPDYFFPEDQRFIAEEFFPRVLRHGHGDVEIRLRHFQTGEPIWTFYYLFSVRDAGGTPVGWATVSRDITERRQAEEALRQSRQAALNLMTDAIEARERSEQTSAALAASEASYQTLFSEMQNGFAHSEIICDTKGRPIDSRYLAVNPAFERITGRKVGDVVGRTLLEVFPALEAGWMETFGRVALTGEPEHFEMRAAELGITFDVSAFCPAPNQYACTFSDITPRKQAEAEIRELNLSLDQRVKERTAELLAANQELDAFAYAVSHDLRQPLRAMNGFSQALLEDSGATLPGAAHEHLDEIILASRRMGALIDGLLRLSRTTRGELQRDAVDLSAMAARILGELAAAEPERHVTWTVAPGLTARGDERMVEVLLANLLGNAWKYTAKTPQPAIRVFGQHTGNEQEFCVADNGAGFDMQHAARLFQPFQRLHREDEYPGIGIGLATAQRIVHRHGGSIWATAAPGQGATFSFTLSGSEGDIQQRREEDHESKNHPPGGGHAPG